MATFYIFADESGTMPINDTDKPFVAATIAFQGQPPKAISGSDSDDKIIAIFKKLDAKPFATIVKPFPRYAQMLSSKYSKMKTMAMAKCLLDGRTIQYMDKDDINLHNEIWHHAMLQSIMHTVLGSVFDSKPIDKIKFIFDEKTMRSERRDFFHHIITHIGTPLRQYLDTFKHKYSNEIISSVQEKIQFTHTSISIYWSDQSIATHYKFGLKLADRFARKVYQDLNNQKPEFYALLQKEGFEKIVEDITNAIVRPLSKNLINRWQKETGLPEPQL
jgi:hypothetical protein